MASLYNFQVRYNAALFHSWSRSIESILKLNEPTGKTIQKELRKTFDDELRGILTDKDFSKSLSHLISASTEIATMFQHDKAYRNYEKSIHSYDDMVESFRDYVNRTHSEIISMPGEFEMHHYKTSSPKKFETPILVVGSLINRHYILDLLPETSVIRFFQQLGFDVYATDWRMPIKDETMSLEKYAHDYLENAVNRVKEISKCRKVTLFGYCWGESCR